MDAVLGSSRKDEVGGSPGFPQSISGPATKKRKASPAAMIKAQDTGAPSVVPPSATSVDASISVPPPKKDEQHTSSKSSSCSGMGEGRRAEFVVDEDDGIARYSTTFVSHGVKTTVSLGSTTIKSDGVKSQFFWGSTTQEGECVDEYSYCVDTPYTDSAAASVSEDGGNNSDLVAQASDSSEGGCTKAPGLSDGNEEVLRPPTIEP
ncbi:unnamed protein product [Pylaiella littoralis]